jgi:hypothetical protein
MEREQFHCVVAMIPRVIRAIDGEFEKTEPASEIAMAMIVHAIGMTKHLGIGEDEFFDTVVALYAATSIEPVEKH